ncbi:hypothetical protein Goari_004881 [Gossypium aridum]|uniref:Uncharacterized protein n=1 Tax=Gossypium aridum TaxID=34290 RepID=A0A7J8Y6I6_GOSAI|nr:hypothetical protein [Gossypium aridum]
MRPTPGCVTRFTAVSEPYHHYSSR